MHSKLGVTEMLVPSFHGNSAAEKLHLWSVCMEMGS